MKIAGRLPAVERDDVLNPATYKGAAVEQFGVCDDVAIDTNAFSSLDLKTAELLVCQIRGRQGRLILASEALAELVAGDFEKALLRIRVLQYLGRSLGTRFVSAPQYPSFVTRERRAFRKGKPFQNTPQLKGAEADGFMRFLGRSDLNDDIAILRRASEGILNRNEWFSLDRKFSSEAFDRMKHGISRESAADELDQFPGTLLSRNNPAVRMFHYGSHAKNLRLFASQHRVNVLFVAYVWLYILGMVLKTVRPAEDKLLLHGPRSGEWIDAKIYATAAYAKFLITDDAPQTEKVNFCSEKFGFGPVAITLRDFLDQGA